jgi:thioredoxin 1
MPVLVNYNRCNCMPTCFAAVACPKNTLRVDKELMKVVVNPTICGDCPAPCLNFCDSVALKFAPNLEELDIIARELDGELSVEQAAAERRALAEKRKAEEAATKEAEEAAKYAPIKLTMQNFVEEVSREDTPIVIDFWAEWCQPCKQLEPVINQLAQEFAGKIRFGKLNIDEEKGIANQLGIQSIPTLMVFFQGQMAMQPLVGVLPKAQLQSVFNRIVQAVEQMKAAQVADANAAPDAANPPAPPTPPPSAPRPSLYGASLRPVPPRKKQ